MERREAIGVRRHEKDTRRMPVASVGLYRLTRYTIKTVKVSGYGSFGRLIRSGKLHLCEAVGTRVPSHRDGIAAEGALIQF